MKKIHVKLCIARHDGPSGFHEEIDLQYFEDHWDGVIWVDRLLDATTNGKFSLMSILNDIQGACTIGSNSEPVFKLKPDIPLLLVNMAIEKFNLVFKECQ